MREGTRDLVVVGFAWLGLSALGEWWASSADLHPLLASEEGEIVDGAFDLLLLLAVPVFAFVLVVLVYAVVRFRAGRTVAPSASSPAMVWGWLTVTSALAVFVVFNPGLSGLAELDAAATNHDLQVFVLAEQWQWSFTFPQYELTVADPDELVLPVDTRIRFRVSSADVIHSFWVPGFRVKIDAVPGRITEVTATPTILGSFDTDPNLRVQCAELCGTGHARMRTPVRIVEPEEFQAWMEDRLAEQGR